MLDLNSLYLSDFAGLSKWVSRRYPALDAEDVVQSAYCRLWQIQDRLTGYTNDDIKRFLHRIVRTKAVSAIRRACAVRRSSQRKDYREPAELSCAVYAANTLDSLTIPAESRQLLDWRYRDGMTLEAIGELLGLARNSVHDRIKSALATVRELNPEFA